MMLGKYTETLKIELQESEFLEIVDCWADQHGLTEVKTIGSSSILFRFGSPVLSNPIYIELALENDCVILTGWVQTLLPFFRWKLVEYKHDGLGAKIDYRRKGGYFAFSLKQTLTNKVSQNDA